MDDKEIPKHFCVLPWLHLYIDTWGRAKACCVSQIQYGDVNEQDLDDIWKGTAIEKVRSNMLMDLRDHRCATCYRLEDKGHLSLRQSYNQQYKKHVFDVLEHQSLLPIAEAPLFWDVRFSNYCNFKCITCWHGASSKWYSAAKEKGQAAGKQAVLKAFADDSAFFAYFEYYLQHVESVFMAGGEPLIMPENKKMLQLLSHSAARPKVTINTNLSVINQDDIRFWNQNMNLNFQVSFDGIGPKGMEIRDGLKEKQFYENLAILQSLVDEHQISVHFTLSKFNLDLLFPTIRQFETLNVPQDHFMINVLERPQKMQYQYSDSNVNALQQAFDDFKWQSKTLQQSVKNIIGNIN